MQSYEQADAMPQLNVRVPRESSLLERIEAAAGALGTSPSSLARAVLEAALEPYVEAHVELRDQVAGRFLVGNLDGLVVTFCEMSGYGRRLLRCEVRIDGPVFALLKGADFGIDLQFINFRTN